MSAYAGALARRSPCPGSVRSPVSSLLPLAPRPVVPLVVGAERGPVEPLESGRAAERGRAVRVASVQTGQHGIEGDRIRLVLTVADRPQELAALAVQLIRGQRRVKSDVGDH